MQDTLGFLIGRWSGEEQIATTRWGQGGPATAEVDARIELGGKSLVIDYREQRDGKPALQAHAVIAAGPEHDRFELFWFDSYGFVPSTPAPGHWDGKRLVFLRSSPRGQTRHVYTPKDDGSYTLALESSFDGGVQWEAVMSGTYRRIA
ncbi:DUF1579 family protein [Dyella sp. LX-66]|uniref:DUF1579 family protein n=1 Tax=unclassified Dyella TaxID=2634549 RepID=UPI001BE05FD9|nr:MULTISPECIES: DUF1579 family protein [unclassified Dyella]MBT2118115.1 DUF1579 family protein [Dyella sp. LX-1]MBT2141022.1 DUF1579 family protein [Dyella sp. LX-66]